MSRERYAPWASGADDGELARALACAGLVAGYAGDGALDPDPAAATGRVRGTVRAERGTGPLRWRDPATLPGWDPARMAPVAAWAGAWSRLGVAPGARFVLTGPTPADPGWLSDLLCGRHVGGSSAFVALAGSTLARPWRFPLRIGHLDDPPGRLLGRRLAPAAVLAGPDAVARLGPVGRERVTCDLLLLPGGPAEAADAVRAVRELHAGAVLALGPGSAGPGAWDPDAAAGLAAATGAWAVGACDPADPQAWLEALVDGLCRNGTLDVVFRRVTAGSGAVLAAVPDVVGTQRVSGIAAAAARLLRHAAAGPGDADLESAPAGAAVADALDAIASAGDAEVGADDAATLVRLERRATRLIGRGAVERWVQARIAVRDEAGERPVPRFARGAAHRVDVRIGTAGGQWLTAADPLPAQALPAGVPHRLTVVLTEPTLLDRPLVGSVLLPVAGSSSVATFPLVTRPDTEVVDARVVVLSGNRVLQTALLPARTDPAGGGAADGPGVRREAVVAAPAGDLSDRRRFDAAVLVDHGPDGGSRATTVAGDRAATVRLDHATLGEALGKVTRRLGEIVDAPDDFAGLEAPASVELLVFLAFHGVLMRQALVEDSPGLATVLAGSRYLQVVSAQPDAFFPIEFAYDFPAPSPEATLCPGAAAALRAADPDGGCPGAHSRDTVCPFGFWGLTRVIERHAFQPAAEVPGAFLLRGRPTGDRGRIPLGPAVLAASDRVDAVRAGAVAEVRAALDRATAGTRQVTGWDDWPDAVGSGQPALLLLLPHTVFSDVLDAFGLEIGRDSRRWSAEIDERFVPPPERPVIVALLGCETARAGEVGYERFPGLLRRAGAEVVIGTLTEVLGRHAAPVAARLVEELYGACAAGPTGVGEVMLRLRRRLLADGLMPVLALAAFGDADWLVTATPGGQRSEP